MNLSNLSIIPIDGVSIALGDCTETLELLSLGEVRRTVNGRLVAQQTTKKYRSVLKGEGKVPIGFDELKRGQEIVLYSIQRITQIISTQEVITEREPVDDSLFITGASKELIAVERVEGKEVVLKDQPASKVTVSYRPILHMRLLEKSCKVAEWGKEGGWKIILEEI